MMLLPPLLPLLSLLSLLCRGSLSQFSGFTLQVLQSVTVQEALCVSIPCTFTYPNYKWNSQIAHGYWFRIRDESSSPAVAATDPTKELREETRGRFRLIGDLQKKKCTLSISNVRKEDAGIYYFRLQKGEIKYSYKNTEVSVEVTALTQEPEVRGTETLRAGCPATMTCLAPGNCKSEVLPTFSWTGTVLSPRRDPSLTNSPGPPPSSVLSFTPGSKDHGSNLTCRVTFPGTDITIQTTVRLSVTYLPAPPTIRVYLGNSTVPTSPDNASSLTVPEGGTLRLVCSAPAHPPATLSWTRVGLGLSLSPRQGPQGLELELARLGSGDGGEYVCRAHHPHGGTRLVSLTLVLQSESPGKSLGHSGSYGKGLILGAAGGVGVTTLIFLCLILLIVKTLRAKLATPEPVTFKVQGIAKADSINLVSKTIPLPEFQESRPDGTLELPSYAEPDPAKEGDGEEAEELQYYASLTFQPRQLQDTIQSGEITEYSEIKFQ
ncbi:sialic acid-binding Ig-like lectin 13 isoform X2 [Ornithorhynchus anatinus]|uniref:sialic acid-binding Ig-like lectin 13 isoform X2 n=1 Tax=Ornithorhynchus anatinus TaxID=9258 RepID=UPI0010A751F4|nr:sialic acid-binding Ig-like lectin 13 isoform X2 [Ornithorhynchus anatinus]